MCLSSANNKLSTPVFNAYAGGYKTMKGKWTAKNNTLE